MNRTARFAAMFGDPDGFLGFVRIYLGIGLFAKAVYFMANTDTFTAMIRDSGDLWFAPVLVAHYVIMAHLMGGILLATGLVTRWAAAFQIPVLLGAVFYVHLPKIVAFDARQNFEFSMLVLFLLCLFTVYGGGKWSLDAKLRKDEQEEEARLAHRVA